MRLRLVIAAVLWGALITCGFTWVTRRSLEAGPGATAPAHWPAGIALARAPLRETLVMILHPECPCSQATVAELERLMRDRAGTVDVRALFVRPHGLESDPRESSLWTRVSRISGVTESVDDDGVIAARFGTTTSGQTLLYDASGTLRFAGGITGSRGHEGDNAGRDAVETILDHGRGPPVTPVFGCSLFEEKNR